MFILRAPVTKSASIKILTEIEVWQIRLFNYAPTGGLMPNKRAAVYLRCSTPSQETDMQESELREYVRKRDWECKVYRDKGQSGVNESRPALDLLLSDVRRRKIDVITVWTLDRLGRSLKQLLSIAEECKELGVD